MDKKIKYFLVGVGVLIKLIGFPLNSHCPTAENLGNKVCKTFEEKIDYVENLRNINYNFYNFYHNKN